MSLGRFLDRLTAGCPIHDFEPCKREKCLFYLPYNNPNNPDEYNCLFIGMYLTSRCTNAHAFRTDVMLQTSDGISESPLSPEVLERYFQECQEMLLELQTLRDALLDQGVWHARFQETCGKLEGLLALLRSRAADNPSPGGRVKRKKRS